MDPADWDDFEKAVGEVREATAGATLVLNAYFGEMDAAIRRRIGRG